MYVHVGHEPSMQAFLMLSPNSLVFIGKQVNKVGVKVQRSIVTIGEKYHFQLS
jgi:hypothetical protein